MKWGLPGSFSAEADTPIACPGRRHLEEAAPSVRRRLGRGGAVIKYLPLSQREQWRLCEAWTNRRRQASGRLPASHLSPRRNFLGGQKCAYRSLHAWISTWPQVCLHQPPPHPQTPRGLSFPLLQGHLRLQSLGFLFRQWSQGSTEDREQERETGESRPGVLF